MARLLRRLVEEPRPCSYLPGRPARLEHRLIVDVGPAELDALLRRGWRRNGPFYFRPACAGCAECVSMRLPVGSFSPTPSQLRAHRRCARFRVALGAPRVDGERLALYAAWHAEREARRGWEPSPLDAEEYAQHFGIRQPGAAELSFRDGDRLVALGVCDVTARSFSLVYFFYHPDVARLSPGVANVTVSVAVARSRGIPHVYLGYRVLSCPSMRYKAAYGPAELLLGLPAEDEEPRWVRPEEHPLGRGAAAGAG